MEDEIEDCIRKKIQWPLLPATVKKLLGDSPKEYERYIFEFSIKNQLRYRGSLVRTVRKDEKKYYETLVQSSIQRLMLYPYHLADMIVKGLRITPFIYYVEVVALLIELEKSYDTMPNFTAADCLRLLGIGRNEYLELVAKARSLGRRGRAKAIRALLPRVPLNIPMQPWWRVELGYVLEDDVKPLSESERAVIDLLIDRGSQTAGTLDYYVVKTLYRRGLIYLDVPITTADKVSVPPLKGFVMNRIAGDYFETLLYKVFVSIDEHTSVADLAAVLQVECELVKQAVSLYCRLGFANNMQPPPVAPQHASWRDAVTTHNHPPYSQIAPLTFDPSIDDDALQMEPVILKQTPSTSKQSPEEMSEAAINGGRRVAVLFDSTLAAYLMMGNLSPDLKSHAVTLFEVGKLPDESLDSLLMELDKVVADPEIEGEARRYLAAAACLRIALRTLRPKLRPLDLLRCEALHALGAAARSRLLSTKYKLAISTAPLCREARAGAAAGSLPHVGPAPPEAHTPWMRLYLYHVAGYGPPTLLLTKGTQLRAVPRLLLGYSRVAVSWWGAEAALEAAGGAAGALAAAPALAAANSALRRGPVLLQAAGVRRPAPLKHLMFPPEADPCPGDALLTLYPVLSLLAAAPALAAANSALRRGPVLLQAAGVRRPAPLKHLMFPPEADPCPGDALLTLYPVLSLLAAAPALAAANSALRRGPVLLQAAGVRRPAPLKHLMFPPEADPCPGDALLTLYPVLSLLAAAPALAAANSALRRGPVLLQAAGVRRPAPLKHLMFPPEADPCPGDALLTLYPVLSLLAAAPALAAANSALRRGPVLLQAAGVRRPAPLKHLMFPPEADPCPGDALLTLYPVLSLLAAAPALAAANSALRRGPVLLQAAGVRRPAPLKHLMFPPEADPCPGDALLTLYPVLSLLAAAPALAAANSALRRGPVLLQAAGVRRPAPLKHLMFPPEADPCPGDALLTLYPVLSLLAAAPALAAANSALRRGPVLLQAAGVRRPAPLKHLMFPPEADPCPGDALLTLYPVLSLLAAAPALAAANSALRRGPVLLQAAGVRRPAPLKHLMFPPEADPCPESQGMWTRHAGLRRLLKQLRLTRSVGYVTLADIGVPDLGCARPPTTVQLVQTRKKKDICGMAKPISEVSLSSTDSTEKYTEEYSKTLTRLQSPIESHFAVTPTIESKNSSPANGFTSVECGQLLCDELDNLALEDISKHAQSKESIACSDDLVPIHSSSTSIEDLKSENKKHSKENSSKESIALSDDLVPIHSTSVSTENLSKKFDKSVDQLNDKSINQLNDLLSPAEESISMFTQLSDKLTEMSAAEGDSGVDTAHNISDDETCRPERWTILDLQFGIPLFDEALCEKTCKCIVERIAKPELLEKVKEDNDFIRADILKFVSQCQYYPGEDMGIVKRGTLVPLPRKNLAFENGRISEWTGK